jgi:hypothetical protein
MRLKWIKKIVGIAPQPVFAWLGRAHYRMAAGMIMLGGVFVG